MFEVIKTHGNRTAQYMDLFRHSTTISFHVVWQKIAALSFKNGIGRHYFRRSICLANDRAYYEVMYVWMTTEGPVWNTYNIGRAFYNDPNKGPQGFVCKSFVGPQNEWLKWSELLEWLREIDPGGDHRYSWWIGDELK